MPFYLIVIVLTIIFRDKPFFWDKDIINTIRADWLLNSGFNYLFPNLIDTGHPPFMPTFLAISWKLFGRSLMISHFIMLPFSIGLVWQSYLLIKRFAKKNRYVILFLVLLDTAVLTQIIVVSSDLIILFLLLLCVNAILAKKRSLLTIALIPLAMVNMRSMIVCSVVFFFDYFASVKNFSVKTLVRIGLNYIPGALAALTYITLHFIQKGWIMQHDASPWAGCFETVGFTGFLRNIVIFVWRIGDYGKFVYLALLAIIGFNIFKRKWHLQKSFNPLIVLIILLTLSYLPYFRYNNLLSHRYIIPLSYIISIFILTYLSNTMENVKNIKRVFLLVFIAVVSGSFWIYPDKIAQGWDATLAHIPYHKLHKEIIEYIDNEEISLYKIGSVTPNLKKLKYIYLTEDERAFVKLDMNKNKYVLYSNVFNDFTDNEIDQLKSRWVKEKHIEKNRIFITLYKNPNIKWQKEKY